MIYLRFRKRIKLDEITELIPIVTFPLAAVVYPLKGEFHYMIIEVLHPSKIAAHSIILVMSKQLYSQQLPPFFQFNTISDTLHP